MNPSWPLTAAKELSSFIVIGWMYVVGAGRAIAFHCIIVMMLKSVKAINQTDELHILYFLRTHVQYFLTVTESVSSLKQPIIAIPSGSWVCFVS